MISPGQGIMKYIMKNKKIAVLLPDLRGGGAEKMRVNLAHYWVSKGIQVEFVLVNAEGVLLDALPKEAKIVDLNSTRLYKSIIPLLKYIKNSDANILLVAMWPLTVIAAFSKLIAMSKMRLVVSDHSILSKSFSDKSNIHNFIMRLTMQLFYRVADERIGVSFGVANEMARLAIMPKNMFHVIYNPAYSKENDELSENIGNECKIIITAGSFKPVKNHFLLIKAFSIYIKNSNFKTKLYILGEGSLKGEYEKLVNSLGLVDSVIFPGYIENPKSFFNAADLFVLSSDHEGLGNVIIEALGCGLPVVSTDCESGPREILENGKYGKLVPVGDAEALAEAIYQSFNEQHDVQALKRRAQDFSIDKIAQKYLNVMFPETK
jgi:glycosyltransferase involved in cell wall biosynthesis